MDKIDYSKFQLSLKRLEEQHENHRHADTSLPEITREGIAESVIQRFETCYDCLWKVLKRYLIVELGIADPPNSPKPVFRLAHENQVLSSALEEWFGYAEARTDTSHDYDGEKAKACLTLTPNFIADAVGLYETMTGQSWQ
ncbi:MAG: nucleotidyltransferase substrate binding protein [Gammaproteobacteria bacterium]|nr:nucleotidyltransferase substrate binding protein [Gammaproteobacteria bacterium]MXX06326.1 nucleotidyltransferase [Gammaproteobacteria bacterium]MYA36806.1 nucleotidyltransferase [Gammaproteobacteria bacterium]MYE30368.1 nucleotidyltransferase [Gammaproteobacteria bacterium]MYH84491.1 nucleotidyltransferase [Gammaproteobacteria bacterium]